MRVRGKGATLVTAEGETPPLPYIEVDAEAGRDLIARGVAEDVDGLAVDEEIVESVSPPKDTFDGQPPAPAGEPPAQGPEAQIEPEAAEEAGEKTVPTPSRIEEIAEAIELLDEEDFVKTGPRAGKPKAAPLAGVLGFEVTAEEVDAAFALKKAGQGE